MSPADAYSPVPRKTRALASVLFGIALLLTAPAAASAADFTWSGPVIVNQTVRFTAHPDGALHYEWDLNEDGKYADDTGRTVPRTFHNVRTYEIGMRILDAELNVVEEVRKNVVVNAPSTNTPPTASFVYFPTAPVAGLPITLVSTSVDPDSAIPASAERWDLNGDGLFDDATGPSATATFPAPGVYQVSLQVTTNARHVVSLPVAVGAPGAGPTVRAFSLMSPFPVIRIAGRVSRRGARIRRLSIDAPPGSSVKIRCVGRGCPFKSASRTVSMRTATGSAILPPSRLTRIRRVEGHTLRTRAILRVFVTRSDVIGKYTRFRIRKGKPPARQDSCLIPGNPKPVGCPAG